MPKEEIFGFEPAARPEQIAEEQGERAEDRNHRPSCIWIRKYYYQRFKLRRRRAHLSPRSSIDLNHHGKSIQRSLRSLSYGR
jgi:hypothetical protein